MERLAAAAVVAVGRAFVAEAAGPLATDSMHCFAVENWQQMLASDQAMSAGIGPQFDFEQMHFHFVARAVGPLAVGKRPVVAAVVAAAAAPAAAAAVVVVVVGVTSAADRPAADRLVAVGCPSYDRPVHQNEGNRR